MSEYRISDAARSTGFSVSTLRFDEKEGVVIPGRSARAYRIYGDDDLEALRFARRGKQLGLKIAEIKELAELLEDEDCAPMQGRIEELVSDRISQAQEQVAELVGFTSPLQVHRSQGSPGRDRIGPRQGRMRSRREPTARPSTWTEYSRTSSRGSELDYIPLLEPST